jgi:hypothetical protein
MDLFRNTLEPSYFKKVGSDLIYPRVFDYATPVFVLNPTEWTPANGQITSKAQLDSEKTEFSGDLTVLASNFQDSAWTSAGWNLADLSTDIQNFYNSNLIFEESSFSLDNYGMNYVIVKKNIDGTDYTVVFFYVGNYTNDVTWEILMSTSGYMSSPTSAFGSPGSASFRTATATSSEANTRTAIGDGAGLYSSFFTKKNITKLALIDGSGGLNPASNSNYIIYDLVEGTGEESIYDILLRLDAYLRDTSSFGGNDTFLANNFYNPSVLNITSGLNGYSGLLSSIGGNLFKTNDNQTPDKICIMGINADADNDIQALCAYSGDLSTNSGKGDSWRGTNPSQTFWSYWGNDFHASTQTQRIGAGWQTPPGIATGVSTYSSNIYLIAF